MPGSAVILQCYFWAHIYERDVLERENGADILTSMLPFFIELASARERCMRFKSDRRKETHAQLRAGPVLRDKESRQLTWADTAGLQFPLLLCTSTELP